MTKIYKCSWETINAYCNNEATILLIHSKHRLPRIVCEKCYNKYFIKHKYLYKSDLPVSEINNIKNIIDILND